MTALLYADQRYYASSYGRFNTADQYMAAANGANDPKNPSSWNRYSYVLGDPVNAIDPRGRNLVDCGGANGFFGGGGPCGFGGWGGGGDPCTDFFGDSSVCEGGGPTSPVETQVPSEWDSLGPACQQALQTAVPNTGVPGLLATLNRAMAAESTLVAATAGTSISWEMLAAIGVRESAFQNITEADGAGVGVGVFQITVSSTSGVTAAQAGNLASAAGIAANMLNFNMTYLAGAFQNFTPGELLQATAASYNFGTKNISGNPNTIDVGTTGGNYGSNVVQLMNCFP